MLILDERDATLVGKASATVKEVEEGQPAKVTFELSSIELSKAEFCALLREPLAWDALLNERDGLVEPLLKSIKALELNDSMVGAYVRIASALDAKRNLFEAADCKISKIKITLGAYPLLSCKVERLGEDATAIKALLDKLGETVAIELRGEPPGAQRDLPLNKFGDGEKAERAADRAKH